MVACSSGARNGFARQPDRSSGGLAVLRIASGLSVILVVLSGLFWPAVTAVSDPLSPLVPPLSGSMTVDGASARIVAQLNAAALQETTVARADTQLDRQADGERLHLVGAGDSLFSIALAHYGTTRASDAILSANRDRIADPSRLEPGTVLRLPDYRG